MDPRTVDVIGTALIAVFILLVLTFAAQAQWDTNDYVPTTPTLVDGIRISPGCEAEEDTTEFKYGRPAMPTKMIGGVRVGLNPKACVILDQHRVAPNHVIADDHPDPDGAYVLVCVSEGIGREYKAGWNRYLVDQ